MKIKTCKYHSEIQARCVCELCHTDICLGCKSVYKSWRSRVFSYEMRVCPECYYKKIKSKYGFVSFLLFAVSLIATTFVFRVAYDEKIFIIVGIVSLVFLFVTFGLWGPSKTAGAKIKMEKVLHYQKQKLSEKRNEKTKIEEISDLDN